jgi:hypothetical protein
MIGLMVSILTLTIGGVLAMRFIGRAYWAIQLLQRDLRQSEAPYRAMADLATDCAYAIVLKPDGDLAIEWATEAFTRITGAP